MGQLIVVLGPTGSGKSTQAKELAARHHMAYVSSGDLARASRKPDIMARLARGDLVAPGDVQGLVGQALKALPAHQDVVLDGFPRTLSDVEWLQSHQYPLKSVLEINVPEEVAQARLQKRHRTDDEHALIAHKWQWYHDVTSKVVEYYRTQGLLHVIDGSGTPDEVRVAIEAAL